MNIFLINYIVMIVEALWLLYRPKEKNSVSEVEIRNKKKLFVILMCIQWVLISCFRADTVGADTANYARIFELHSELSWKECFDYFKAFYVDGEMLYEFEPGFVFFEKLVSSIWYNQALYKFAVAAIFMTSLGRFVYKNSDDPFIAFLLYSGLFYNMFSLTGYRQVLSVAIGILWAYEYVKKRKFFRFLILVLIGAMIHKTTLVFIPFYFLSKKKITVLYGFCSILTILAMVALRNPLFNLVKGFVGYDEYGEYTAVFTQRNFLIFFAILAFLCIWRHRYVAKECPESHIYYNGLIMSAAMIPFAMVSPTSMRLVYDFAFMLMILIPKVYQSFSEKRDRIIAYAGSVAVFGYFVATKAIEYEFFWEVL